MYKNKNKMQIKLIKLVKKEINTNQKNIFILQTYLLVYDEQL